MNAAEFKKLPVMGIIRGIKEEELEPLVETIISSGLKTIEITMNTVKAEVLIDKAIKLAGRRLTIGAGTVLTMDSVQAALDAGATFIVTPVLIKEVVNYCVKQNIPVFPGALTPTEIAAAAKAGATMVKVFPAKFFGPEYFKEIKGPFNDVKLLACAGVTPENMKEYFLNGADAVSFGASVFKKEWLSEKKFDKIGQEIKKFTSQIPL